MTTLLALVANGATYIAAVWIYLHAMAKEEASRVTPWFLVIPAFGIGLAFFTLGELPSWYQTIAIVGIVLAGFALSIKDGVANKKVVGMMLVSACLLAVNDVIFAKFGRELNWTQALFADVLGKAFWGLMVL
ncbi:MAG: hypothetical protein WCO03_02545, partial [bacterium]